MSNPFEPPATEVLTSPSELLRKDADAALTALVLIPVGMCACYLTWPVAAVMMGQVWLRRRAHPFQPATPEQALLDRLVRTGIGVTLACNVGFALLLLFYVGVVAVAALGAALGG